MQMWPRATTHTPDSPAAHLNLGNALKESGRVDDAIAAYRQAIGLKADFAEAHRNLGVALVARGRLDEAIAACRAAITIMPGSPEIHANLGLALQSQGNIDEAIAAFLQAIALQPDNPAGHMRLANALRQKGEIEAAAATYRRVLALKADHHEAVLNLSNLLYEDGRIEEAIAGYRRAIELKADFAQAYSNLGNALRDIGRVDEAIAACRRAIMIMPDLADGHFNLSLALLLYGQFGEGWQEYEWRWKGGSKDLKPRDFKWSRWRGQDLTGKRLLLHAEQGLGDTLQFARFVSILATQCGAILLAVQPPLVRLLGLASWPDVTISDGARLSGVDFELPLMSVPYALGTTEATIPADVPYLVADTERVAFWNSRLPQDGFRIGIAWRARPNVPIDRGRSFPLRCLAPLARLPGVRLISLQKDHALEELKTLPSGMIVETLGPEFDAGPGGFVDAAAVMMSLDLVISVDTSLAHLAGALGRPVWIALQRVPDWRWLLEREDTPWYPTARLFRQRAAGEWDEVFARMAAELVPVGAGDRAGAFLSPFPSSSKRALLASHKSSARSIA